MFIRDWCIGSIVSVKMEKRLDGKVAVITGANSGIGEETAKDLSRRGARVIMLCRDLVSAKQTAVEIGNDVHIIQCDLASLESVRKCASSVMNSTKTIDFLINNAGIMGCNQELSPDGYDLQLASNHLGHFLLTELLLPKMSSDEKTGFRSKVVIVSSFAHKYGQIRWEDPHFLRGGYSPMKAYGQSKLGNVLHGLELAKRHPEIEVCVVNPGVVLTNISRHSKVFRFLFFIGRPWLKTAHHGAQTTLYCILKDEGDEGGIYYSDCRQKDLDTTIADPESSKRFWELSERLVYSS